MRDEIVVVAASGRKIVKSGKAVANRIVSSTGIGGKATAAEDSTVAMSVVLLTRDCF